MKLIWHCHACFELITPQGSVVFDPYAPQSVRGLRLPELHADSVICSHGHSDHNYEQAVALSGRQPDFKITQIPTYHDGKLGGLRGNNLCTVIDTGLMRIAHLGDLGHTLGVEALAGFGKIDVLMIPVGGFYTVCAKQAHDIAVALGAKTRIPMHYRCTDAGLDEVAGVDDFLRLWDKDEIVYLDGCEYEFTSAKKRQIVVFKPDPACMI